MNTSTPLITNYESSRIRSGPRPEQKQKRSGLLSQPRQHYLKSIHLVKVTIKKCTYSRHCAQESNAIEQYA